MKKKINNLTVFCASSQKIAPRYFSYASELAEVMIENNINLVFGGANVGLMKILAEKIFSAGLKVTGIIPEFFVSRGLASECSTELIITKDMHERKKLLIDKADAFVALPGGYGTLDELIEVITLNQIKQIHKKVIIYDPEDFYKPLKELFKKFVNENFITPDNIYNFVKSKEELKDIIK